MFIETKGKKICIANIGKLYYESGMPISMSVQFMSDKGIEVSMLHVADELLKNGFTPDRVCNILEQDAQDGHTNIDIELMRKFCNSTYEQQRKMIFTYLYE